MASGMLSTGMPMATAIPGMTESPHHSEMMDGEEIQRRGWESWICWGGWMAVGWWLDDGMGGESFFEFGIFQRALDGTCSAHVLQVFNTWGPMGSRWLGTSGSMPTLEKWCA